MIRLIRWLIFGYTHDHNWIFTHVTQYSKDQICVAEMSCMKCGKHKQKTITYCNATYADQLNVHHKD